MGANNRKNELVAALCLMHEGETGPALFAFASPQDEKDLIAISARLGKEGAIDPDDVLARIQKTKRTQLTSGLDQVHPGWILEKLEGESPLVLGIVCRNLSGDKVKYLIEHLPEAERRRLPKVSESYHVSSQIAEIVKEGVERKFAYNLPEAVDSSFSLPHVTLIKPDDLKTLFWDLGLEEIRKAFRDSDPNVLKAFLARFSPKMAKEIRDRIQYGGAVPTDVHQEAQKHLVTLPLEKLPVERLFVEIGYSVFARALGPEDFEWAEIVYQKLPPEEGYRLKRVMTETVPAKSHPSLQTKKDLILGRIYHLVEKGQIRRYWKGSQKEKAGKAGKE